MEKLQKNNLFSQIVKLNNKDWEQYSNVTYLKDVRGLSYNIFHMLEDTLPKFEGQNEYSNILKEIEDCKACLFILENYYKKYEKVLGIQEKLIEYKGFFNQKIKYQLNVKYT